MTTVVAVQNKDGLIFGCDSQVSGHYYDNLKSPKVAQNGPYTIGVAGFLGALQAIHFADLPTPPKGLVNYDRFVKTVLIPAVRAVEEAEDIERGKSSYLFGFHGELYHVSTDGVFLNSANNFLAIGSGSIYARGYLLAVADVAVNGFAERDVEFALQAAARNDPWTSGPFHIKKVLNDNAG